MQPKSGFNFDSTTRAGDLASLLSDAGTLRLRGRTQKEGPPLSVVTNFQTGHNRRSN